MTNPRTHGQNWLEQNALFGCQFERCAEQHSYPASMLYVWNDEPICEYCFDEIGLPEGDETTLYDLPPFNPFPIGDKK